MICKWTLVLILVIPTSQRSQERGFKCNQNERRPVINIEPPDALIPLNVSTTTTQTYMVHPGWRNKTFVVNCTCNAPVDWRFKGSIGNTITRSERSMSYEGYEEKEGFLGPCYYSALIFTITEDEITGRYTCLVRPSLKFNPQTNNGALFHEITLFSGLSPLTIRNETKMYDLNWLLILIKDQNYDKERYPYRLPCAKNHPDATMSLFYTIITNNTEKHNEWREVKEFVENSAVSVTVELSEDDLPRKFKCEAKLGNSVERLYIDIPSYPEAVYWPDVNNIVYKTNTYNTFYCISRLPIRFIKKDKIPTTLQRTTAGFVQHYINMGFNYTAAVSINMGNKRGWGGHEHVGTLTCQDTATNGSLINWSWNYDVGNGGNSNKPRNYLNGLLKKAVCKTSVNAEQTKIRYITAATHAELSLQQKCLNLPTNEWNICNHPKMDLQPSPEPGDDSSFYANLPVGSSGAFQCLTPDVFNDHKHYVVFSETILNELGNVGNPYQDYIQFSSSTGAVVQFEDAITTTCISSLMYFHGAGIWVLIWRNSTHSSVPPRWILGEEIKKVNTFYERRANITAGSTELVGITCVAIPIQPPKDRNRKVIYPSREYIPINVKPKAPFLSFLEMVVIVLGVSVVGIVGLIATGFSWLRRQKRGKGVVYGHEQMVEMFFHGYEPRVEGAEARNPCETAESQPYDTSFELVMQNLIINWDSPLGAGAYGFVLNGTYNSILEDRSTKIEKRVAVKTLKDVHPNLVTLIGAITEKLSERELYVVLEHCENGSLDKYMKANRPNFSNTFDTVTGLRNNGLNGSYTNFGNQNQIKMTSLDLFKWSRQILAGMNHLVSKKVIHADLAARNILLDEFLTAKISDFGLSRRLFEQYEYVKKSQEPLPWRNMALESFRDLTFSSETDIWSFGVLVWEIFSLSETPYKGKMYSSEFISMLEAGYRLSSPKYAVGQIYDVMLNCWHEDPSERPTFQEIADTFDGILQSFHAKETTSEYMII